jgi:ABC-type multidrug transport system fused ATPase/permease subunit
MDKSSSNLEVAKFCLTKFFAVIRAERYLRGLFFIAVGVFLIALLFNVTLPLILKFIVQSLQDTINTPQLILVAVGGYGFMWTVAHVGEHIREMTSVRAVECALSKLISSFYEAILSQINPHKRLPSTGSIINRIWTFREGFHNLIWGIFFFLLPTLIEVICACGVLWYLYGGLYSAILLMTIIFYGVCTTYGVSLYLKQQTQTYDQSARVSGFLSDRLFNIETVNALGVPQREIDILNYKLKDLENKTTKTKQIFEVLRIIQGIIIGGALLLITYHSVTNIIEGRQNISDFVLINSYIIQFFTPLSSLGLIMSDIYRSFAEVAGMIDLTKSSGNEKRVSGVLIPQSSPPSLSAKNVCFSYKTNQYSFHLQNINFIFEAGWKIGIVGHSGSGKSTLGRLLCGMYVPEKGEVFLNNIPFSSYDLLALKGKISFAPQQVQLFDDTILANILYANPNASRTELEMAINGAQLEELISRLPHGLDTFLGEQGKTLSGGEKQRIGIARAIVKQPFLYILDEPTSFLDIKNEELVLDYFRSQEKTTTQIIIAHHLHMVMDADWIVFMNKGQLVDQGPPERLIQTCHSFKEWWENDRHNQTSQATLASQR